jgi:hypothetical protein
MCANSALFDRALFKTAVGTLTIFAMVSAEYQPHGLHPSNGALHQRSLSVTLLACYQCHDVNAVSYCRGRCHVGVVAVKCDAGDNEGTVVDNDGCDERCCCATTRQSYLGQIGGKLIDSVLDLQFDLARVGGSI